MNLQNNNKKDNKGKGFLAPAVILFVLLSAIGEIGEMERPEALIGVIGVAVILVSILATVNAVKKHSGGGKAAPARSAARPAVRSGPRAAERAEEAVHCHHSTGKQKYLEQLDTFLANGIIDKAEYRLLKERYSKLDIEDDYH